MRGGNIIECVTKYGIIGALGRTAHWGHNFAKGPTFQGYVPNMLIILRYLRLGGTLRSVRGDPEPFTEFVISFAHFLFLLGFGARALREWSMGHNLVARTLGGIGPRRGRILRVFGPWGHR